jgi:uncharacterized membrane protein
VSATVQLPAEPAAGTSADVAWRLESTISRLLVAGTYLAMGLVLVGVLLMLAAGIDPLAHGGVPPFELSSIPAEIASGNPLGFLWLGLVAVLALPLGRVIVAGVGFLAARDLRLALVSLAVLLVVLGSIVAAIRLEG